MQTEPIITNITNKGNECKLALSIPENLHYFSGHFTEYPILAGVVQLDWAIKFAKKYLPFAEFVFDRVEVLKFQVMILPGDVIDLTLTKMSDNKFKFAYTSEKGKHAAGRVILK